MELVVVVVVAQSNEVGGGWGRKRGPATRKTTSRHDTISSAIVVAFAVPFAVCNSRTGTVWVGFVCTGRGFLSSRSSLRNRRRASGVGSENDIFDCIVSANSGMEDPRKVIEEPVLTNISTIDLAACDLEPIGVHV